jgi:hypothetical protein
MKEIIGLFTQIALLRRGPQDLPASRLLLLLTIAGYLCVNLLMSLVLLTLLHSAAAADGEVRWVAPLLVGTVFTLLWYVALMRIVKRPERTLQTATAVFGFQAVLAPLTDAFEWLMLRFSEEGPWHVPVACAGLLWFTWLIAVNSHIVKAALEWSSTASVVLVMLQLLVEGAVVLALFVPGNS